MDDGRINKYSGGVAEQCCNEMKLRGKNFGKSRPSFLFGAVEKIIDE
jgi:hypothetical protein